MTMSSGGGGAMYAFLACTASQFMTPTVITVKRQTTIFQLGALFEQHDFNARVGTIRLLEKPKVRRMSRRVAHVMTEAIVHVDPTLPLTRVLQLMVSLRKFPRNDARAAIGRHDFPRGCHACSQRTTTEPR